MKIAITGADGFIGRNLKVRLREAGYDNLILISRSTAPADWPALLQGVQLVFHLAGVNRPLQVEEFQTGNSDLTALLCESLAGLNPPPALVVSSSTQADLDNPYGKSKREAERHAQAYGVATGAPVLVYRLPNVFGKWSRPNYNSAVATFCHQIARGLPIQVNKADASITLVYVDDVVESWLNALRMLENGERPLVERLTPEYQITVGDLAEQIGSFRDSRSTMISERVGSGLVRALYATYVSFLPTESFAYDVPSYKDARGVFVEMLKTADSGQFSFFTAHPGITRGGHYHHTKTEKFLVIRGQARFRFRHIETNERHELFVDGEQTRIVETVPGWTHDITNTGENELVVMLWANEIFDRVRPDTTACEVWP